MDFKIIFSVYASMNESMTSPIILIFWLTHFNPRSYERSDYREIPEKKENKVSIHAPTKGATIDLRYSSRFTWFQSTLLRKERQNSSPHYVLLLLFQSTLLRKERPAEILMSGLDERFQSTLLRKERPRKRSGSRLARWFQSTLLRKERLYPEDMGTAAKIVSIHAPTKGATLQHKQ